MAKDQFNQQIATFKLRQPINEGRVMFTIDDEDVDHLFLNDFEADVDYIHDGPDVYYVTDQNQLERFVDYIESRGLNGDAIQVQEYFKEDMGGNVTGAGEAYLPAMDMPSKKQNPFKENKQEYFIQVDVRDAKRALAIIDDSYSLSNDIKKRGSDVYTTYSVMAAEELIDTLKQNGIKSKNNVEGYIDEDVLSGYTQDKNFRPGHTKDRGGFEYKDLWGLNEMDINDPVLMATRARRDSESRPQLQPTISKNASKIKALQMKRAQIMRDMEQEAELEGGPIADMYGDQLEKIDMAIAMLSNSNVNEAKAIGKTKSGKDIYMDFNNPAHKDFTAADHDDASSVLLTVKSKPGKQSKNTVTPARKTAAKQHFDASKAKQKGLSEAYDKSKIKTNADELARVEAYNKEASSSQKASAEARIKKLKILVGIEKRTKKPLPVLHYGTDWSDYLKKQKVKDAKELEAKLSKSETNENKLSILREMNQIVDEVFSPQDYRKVLQIIDKIKYTNTRLYNAIMDLVDDVYPHKYGEVEALVGLNEIDNNYKIGDIISFKDGEDWKVVKVKDNINKLVIKPHNEKAKENNISLEIDVDISYVKKNINENYSRFKNETKSRKNPEQFHQAVKSVKRKVEEIHKLYEYMERLKLELSESSDGLKYKKYTENAIFKIKEAVKALHIKTKKLK